MSRKTILALALLVGVLGFLVWRQREGEVLEKQGEEVAILEGVERSRVRRLLVENLRRGKSFAFDRLEDGRWRMTEPISMPAEPGRVQRILDLMLERRGSPFPRELADARELELEPPRAIVEVEEEVEGARKRTRVDFGALDLDGLHFAVRARGRILRTWRDIDTAIEGTLDDFIDHQVVERPTRDVVEIHRRGSLEVPGAEPVDLGLDALAEQGVWQSTSPFAARLDPQGAAVFVQAALGLRGTTFADVGRRLLSDFGLDPAEFTIALGTTRAETLTLRFGRPRHDAREAWHCALEGVPIVWTIDEASLGFLTVPASALADAKIVRLPSSEVDGISLALEGRELRLWRVRVAGPKEGRWLASERASRDAAFSESLPADLGRVEDLVARIGALEIADFQPGMELPAAEIRGSIAVQAKEEQQGGSVGADVGDLERGRAVRFQRRGDTLAALVDPAVLDLLATPLADVLSLLVVDVPELDLVELSISGGGVRRRFVRGSKGLWTPPEVAVEARELHPVLDGITILRALRYVTDASPAPLAEPIEIELVASNGALTKFTVGLGPDDAPAGERVQVDREGRRAVAKDQDLHRRLSAVLGGG